MKGCCAATFLRFISWYPGLIPGAVAFLLARSSAQPLATLPSSDSSSIYLLIFSLLVFCAGIIRFRAASSPQVRSCMRGICAAIGVTALLWCKIPLKSSLSHAIEHLEGKTKKSVQKERSFFGEIDATVIDRKLVQAYGKSLWNITFRIHSLHIDENNEKQRSIGSFSGIEGSALSCRSELPCPVRIGNTYKVKARVALRPRIHEEETLSRPVGRKSIALYPRWDTCRHIGRNWLQEACGEGRIAFHRYVERISAQLYSDTERVRGVILSLAFGIPLDKETKSDIHRVGIDHVFAISGFHFGCVAAAAVFLLSYAGSRVRAVGALAIATIFLWIVGPYTPSVLRSWTTIAITFMSAFFSRRGEALNSLGIALASVILYDPSFVHSIGFQLSFLATAAILLLSGPIYGCIERTCLHRRSLEEIRSMSYLDQFFYLVLRIFSGMISLSFSVWLFIVPYSVAFLDGFSPLGCIYNLLIPPIFSLALVTALSSFLLYPISLFMAHISSWIAEMLVSLAFLLIDATEETIWGTPELFQHLFSSEGIVYGLFLVLWMLGIACHVSWKDSEDCEKKGEERELRARKRDEEWKACM